MTAAPKATPTPLRVRLKRDHGLVRCPPVYVTVAEREALSRCADRHREAVQAARRALAEEQIAALERKDTPCA